MTAKGELPEAEAQELRTIMQQAEQYADHARQLIVDLSGEYGISAVARALGISRQAVQARLRAARAPRA